MRLFIGLAVDAQACAGLEQATLALRSAYPAQYVPVSLYHITLAYLGERPREALPALCELLARCAPFSAPFSLTVDRVGFFGRNNSAILYASLLPQAALTALDQRLRVILHEAGEPFDGKPLVPHITLARKAMLPEGWPGCPLPAFRFAVPGLTLYHSARAEGVLCYQPVGFAPFPLASGDIPRA